METEELKKIFSDNLNYWLARRGKTQADLYKRMGVSSAIASDWCNSKKIPRTDKLVDIASWLMIELTDLLSVKERNEDEINDIIFRLKDDIRFRSDIEAIHRFSEENLAKLEDYIKLLSVRG